MNKDKIFDLFVEDNNSIKPLDLPQGHYYAKIGMFTKLILNHFVFHAKLEKFLQKEEPTYSIQSTKEASEFVVFNRAWHYISQINPNDKEVVFAILDFDSKSLNKALESALQYFVEREEYERCAHLFKIQTILKESKR